MVPGKRDVASSIRSFCFFNFSKVELYNLKKEQTDFCKRCYDTISTINEINRSACNDTIEVRYINNSKEEKNQYSSI